jgi:hypothetical protein
MTRTRWHTGNREADRHRHRNEDHGREDDQNKANSREFATADPTPALLEG